MTDEKSEAFITGSRAYGTPREDSDIDLVVLATSEACSMLAEHRDPVSKSVRYGRLNIILFSAEWPDQVVAFKTWREINNQLIKQKPVTREFAKEQFAAADISSFYSEDGA